MSTPQELKARQEACSWSCRAHPYESWDEVGCPHREWTAEQLLSALIAKKEGEQFQNERYLELQNQYVELLNERIEREKAK